VKYSEELVNDENLIINRINNQDLGNEANALKGGNEKGEVECLIMES